MVIIIGGGITGLAAAYELATRNVPFRLLEAGPRTGGLIHTEHVDGFTIDAGPDSMLAQKPAGLALCEELGLGDQLISTLPPRSAFVLKNGRLHALPSPSILGIPTTWRGVARYTLLPPFARARLAIEPFIPRGTQPDESVGAFFRRRFGAATVGLVAEPLLGGIHAGSIESLSLRSLFPRLAEAEATGSVMRAFQRPAPPQAGAGGAGLFRSLARGMGELVTAIERRLPAGSVICDAPVRTLRPDGAKGTGGVGWRVEAGATAVSGTAVIIAAPAYVAAELLDSIDGRAAALCADVPYVSTVSVALAWPRGAISHALAGSGFVVARHHNRVRITACTWVSSKWSARAPAGVALLRAFLGGAHDPDAIELPDDELIELATRDLSGVLGIASPPVFARAYRWRRAGAQHTVGHRARVDEIRARLSHHPGLHVAGSGFGAVGIPDCIAEGRTAASTLA